MKKMLKGAFAAAAMVTLAAGLSAADKKTPAPAADSKANVYAVTFAEIDTDKNGKVTLTEYTTYWAKPEVAKKADAANKDVKAQQDTFKKIDKNGDNAIVLDEYTTFYATPAATPAPAAPAKK